MKISHFVHWTVWLRVLYYSKFWNCEWNPIVWPFKWNLFCSTFARKKRTAKCLCVTNVNGLLLVRLFNITVFWSFIQTDQFIGRWSLAEKFPNKIKSSRLSNRVYPFLCSRRRWVLPYISYIGMCRPIGLGFLGRFGLKTGTHFAHFGLESGMVFEGTAGAYERIYRFNSKWVRKKEKYANLK